MKRTHYYATHRWLGLVIGAQLLLWSLGGLIFSTHDIDWVRGHEGMNGDEPPAISWEAVHLSPAKAVETAALPGASEVHLTTVLTHPVYRVTAGDTHALIDASSGERLSPISESLAVEIARNDRSVPPPVVEATLVEADPETEYRHKPLPAWRVVLEDADNTHIYVDATTAQITARRNDAWRRFDFFWMLHTMDYSGRDDFNTPWLILFASLGVLSVLSGWMLWFLRLKTRRWRRA